MQNVILLIILMMDLRHCDGAAPNYGGVGPGGLYAHPAGQAGLYPALHQAHK